MRRIKAFFDPFLLVLLVTMLLATILPARGDSARIAQGVTTAAVMLLFFLHGAKLSRQAIWHGAKAWKLHIATLMTTFIAFPVLGLLIQQVSAIPPTLRGGLLFLALVPSTVQSSIAFTAIARGNVAAAVVSASFSNLLGIVLTPVLVTLLIAPGGMAGLSAGAAKGIVLQLLLPFALGHALRPWIGGLVDRHKTLVGRVDRGSIAMVVYTAFSAAVVEGLWQTVSTPQLVLVAALSCAMLAIILLLTWAMGRMMGLPREDAIVLQFCGSKKSLASGVPIAGVLFPAAMVGPMVLPLMLFHQVQLIVCAMLARHYGAQADRAEQQQHRDGRT
ncbi:MAG: bile acid:sodium symporter family protein [Sphingobium sp.]